MTHFFDGSTDITSGLTTGGGELGGYLTARDQDIPSVTASLDQLAYGISTAVNTLNNAGTDLDGNTGTKTAPLNIFNAPTEVTDSASQMSVTMTDPNQIAAAGAGDATGDDSNAIAIANLATTTSANLNGQTPSNFYSSFVATLGATVSEVSTESTAQNASVSQLATQNSALSNVNLDDEASAMTTLERSYQAASQVFTMLNTLMASTINLGQSTTVA
jgi:flagellar hook-associated protein 1 FlgK